MTCPHCRSRATSRRLRRTELGYRRFQCRTCRRRFNERTGTRFNEIRFPSDVVMLAVLWRLRYKLSLRDVAEMLLERGYQVTHETVRTWEASFAPLLSERLRAKRRGRIGSSWYIDETYVKGRWALVLPLPGDRRRRPAHRFDAERAPRQARSPTLLPRPRRRCGSAAAPCHN